MNYEQKKRVLLFFVFSSRIHHVMSDTKKTQFAVIEAGGKQHLVSVGDVVTLEKMSGDYAAGDAIVFDKVLLVDDGTKTQVGAPFVANAQVKAEFVTDGRFAKVNTLRYRAKSNYTRRGGHRQPFSKVKITQIA